MQITSSYKPGFYADLSNEAYHADPAISSSGLKMFAEMPALFYLNYLAEEAVEKKRTKAMSKGNRLHTLLLEPDQYNNRYAVAEPECTNSKGEIVLFTRIQKNEWKKFEAQANAEGKEAITHFERNEDLEVVKALLNDPFAFKVFGIPGAVEGSFFSVCQDTSLPIRARPDKLVELPNGEDFEGGLYIIDLKTTAQDLSDSAQVRIAMGTDKRHIQASLHTMVVEQVLNAKVKGVIHMVCDTQWPYFFRCLRLKPEQEEQGHDERQALMVALSKCIQKNVWPSYRSGIDWYPDTPEYLTYPRHYALQIDI